MHSPLQQTLDIIQAAPHSAAALTLYALVNTLEHEQAGGLFRLTKLRDLDAAGRTLAYSLMELMAKGGNQDPAWQEARVNMDAMIRKG